MRVAAALGLAALLCGTGAFGQTHTSGLTRAAVDPTLFRDGEVVRRNQRFGAWSLDCDEVVRLGQRFCSLRALATDPGGEAIARITISTDERGRPAALVDLPLGVDLIRPVEVAPGTALVLGAPSAALAPEARRLAAQARPKHRAGAKATAAARTGILAATLSPDLCDGSGCHAVWSMTPVDIAALRAGASLRVSYGLQTGPRASFARLTAPAGTIRWGTIESDGFAEAVQASLR